MKQILTPSEIVQNLLKPETTVDALSFSNAIRSHVLSNGMTEKKQSLYYFPDDDFEEDIHQRKSTFKNNYVVDFFKSNFNGQVARPSKRKEFDTNVSNQFDTTLYGRHLGKNHATKQSKPNPSDFLNQALHVVNSVIELPNFKKHFDAGMRNPEFLYNYCYKLKIARELDSTTINEYLNTQSFTDLFSEKNLKFLYDFTLHNGKACIDVNSMAFRFMHDNISIFWPEFDQNQVRARLVFIALDSTNRAIKVRDSVAFEFALTALSEYDTGRDYNYKNTEGNITRWTTNKHLVLSAQMNYYEKTRQFTKLQESITRYMNKIWDDSAELNAFAYHYLKNYRNHSKLKVAAMCAIRSIEINSNSGNTSTIAWLLYKMERYENALIYAKRAVELARQEKLPYYSTAKLISLINKMAKRKQ
jgi:tetratricopeptide (TPR) repeat protein